MDEYTIRIESDGVELWRRVFDHVPTEGEIQELLRDDWLQLFACNDSRFNMSVCLQMLQDCSIPGECPIGRIYLDHVWKLRS